MLRATFSKINNNYIKEKFAIVSVTKKDKELDYNISFK